MKKIRKMIVLMLALTVIMAMSLTVNAETTDISGGTYDYNGSSIVTEGTGGITRAVSELEPGDTVNITLTYTNSTDDVTEWYMSNDIVKSLEESSSAAGGGYTYRLTNVGPDGASTEIFNSDAVGGVTTEPGTGLHQATNATEDFFFIQELKAGQSGTTLLTVGLDGESQVNTYQSTDAELTVTYAVEKQAEGETTYKHVSSSKNVKTGDNNNLLLTIATFVAALLMLILGLIYYRKDRKDGEDNEA